ncbi:MAG: helix-turn-helix domain-containing protein [Candidatus Saccharimonas sp.]|nr:helix-turn-helix domain-containing protein [Planctomycetaceae bacterium]
MSDEQLYERLERIEDILRRLAQERVSQKFYSTVDAAKLLGKSGYTVREWCRNHRIRAEKRPCGRGNSQEWMISHEELTRIQAEGLLRPKYGL